MKAGPCFSHSAETLAPVAPGLAKCHLPPPPPPHSALKGPVRSFLCSTSQAAALCSCPLRGPTGIPSSVHGMPHCAPGPPGPYLDEPGQPKIPHFANVVLAHEDVPGSQVPVDVILRLQVAHALGHLGGDVHQLQDGQGFLIRLCRGKGTGSAGGPLWLSGGAGRGRGLTKLGPRPPHSPARSSVSAPKRLIHLCTSLLGIGTPGVSTQTRQMERCHGPLAEWRQLACQPEEQSATRDCCMAAPVSGSAVGLCPEDGIPGAHITSQASSYLPSRFNTRPPTPPRGRLLSAATVRLGAA